MGPGGAQQEQVAIRPRLGDVVGGDVAAGARAVVHDHRLAQGTAQRLGQLAGIDVGAGPVGEAAKDDDGAAGPLVLGMGGGQGGGGRQQRGDEQSEHPGCSLSVSARHGVG